MYFLWNNKLFNTQSPPKMVADELIGWMGIFKTQKRNEKSQLNVCLRDCEEHTNHYQNQRQIAQYTLMTSLFLYPG